MNFVSNGFRGGRFAALAGVVLSGLIATAVAADPVTARTLSERHDQVVKMSQVEREHLERNIAAFEKLPPERQEHYRQLHQELEQDRKNGGQLSTLLQTYSAWLETLTPGQREQLRQETDSQRKLALVQKFKDEQYRQVESFATSPDLDSEGPRPFGVPKPLSLSELQTVLRVLIADLPDEERGRFQGGLRPEQAIDILRRSIQNAPEGPRSWPSSRLQDEIIAALPPQARTLIRRSPVAQREKIVGYVFLSLMFQAEQLRPRYPGEHDLRAFLDGLEPDVQEEMRRRPFEEMKVEVLRRYMDQNERRLHELRNSLNHLRMEIGLTRDVQRFPGRPGDRRPEDRRPDDRRFDDRRPEDRERLGPGERFGPGDRPERPGERNGERAGSGERPKPATGPGDRPGERPRPRRDGPEETPPPRPDQD